MTILAYDSSVGPLLKNKNEITQINELITNALEYNRNRILVFIKQSLDNNNYKH